MKKCFEKLKNTKKIDTGNNAQLNATLNPQLKLSRKFYRIEAPRSSPPTDA